MTNQLCCNISERVLGTKFITMLEHCPEDYIVVFCTHHMLKTNLNLYFDLVSTTENSISEIKIFTKSFRNEISQEDTAEVVLDVRVVIN